MTNGLAHRLQTITNTTIAMMKTTPAAAEPMMSGSFSCMLDLYSSANTNKSFSDLKTTYLTYVIAQFTSDQKIDFSFFVKMVDSGIPSVIV